MTTLFKTALRWAIPALCSVVLLNAQAQRVSSFRLANVSGEVIYSLYIYPENGDLGQDWLGQTILASGAERYFRVNPGVWRVRFIVFPGRQCDVANTDMRQDVFWRVDANWLSGCIARTPQPARKKQSLPLFNTRPVIPANPSTWVLTLNNQSHFKLVAVYMVPAAQDGWGRNIGILEKGIAMDYSPLSTALYKVRVEDEEGDRCEFNQNMTANANLIFNDNYLAGCFARFHGR